MSVKETVLQWIEKMPDDAPSLLDLYEQARLDEAIREAKEDVKAGRMLTFDEADRRMQEKWVQRRSSSN